MSTKLEMKTKQKLLKDKAELLTIKADLESKRNTDEWSSEVQEKLTSVVLQLADIEEALEEAEYKPKLGTEKLVHALIIKGRRFNPNTGKEESKEYIQLFTFSEWSLFKNSATRLGYTIKEILYNPYK